MLVHINVQKHESWITMTPKIWLYSICINPGDFPLEVISAVVTLVQGVCGKWNIFWSQRAILHINILFIVDIFMFIVSVKLKGYNQPALGLKQRLINVTLLNTDDHMLSMQLWSSNIASHCVIQL